jgi:hypothetical protein
MKKLYIIVIVLFCSSNLLFAQEYDKSSLNPCGYTGKSAWLEQYQAHPELFLNGLKENVTTYLPITVTNVGNDDSTGFYNITSLLNAICQLNEDYKPVNIQFYLSQEIRWLKSTELNNAKTFDISGGLYDYNVANTINCYIVTSAAGNCGFDWYGGIVLAKGCIGTGDHTWAHEMGHDLSLPHTFSGWEGTKVDGTKPAPTKMGNKNVELADSTNCSKAGDGFCDTPADYISDRWTCNSDKKSMEMIDPKGKKFRADGRFYMSYANDACMDRFSPDQMTAMRANANSAKANFQDPNLVLIPAATEAVKYISPIDTALVNPAADVVLKWKKVPNAKYYYIQLSRFTGFDITTIRQIVKDTFLKVKNLEKGKKYYWRVKPFNDFSACGNFSTKQVFQTQALSDVTNIEAFESILIYPTLVSEQQTVTARMDLKYPTKLNARLVNISGQVLQSTIWDLGIGIEEKSFDLSAYPKGMYFIQLSSENGLFSQKIVK